MIRSLGLVLGLALVVWLVIGLAVYAIVTNGQVAAIALGLCTVGVLLSIRRGSAAARDARRRNGGR